MPTTFITKKPIDDLSTLSSGFGSRVPPKPKASSKHKGDDFAVYKAPVYAAHNAEVIYKGYNANGWGNFIVLRDPDTGEGTLYGHLSSFSKIVDSKTGLEREIIVGDPIPAGKQIAVSGNSGPKGTDYHLHFEVFGSDAISKMDPKRNGEYRSPIPDDVRENPRDHLSAAFPTEFPTDVLSGPNAIDVIGDFRENTLIGNSRPNNMIGKEGFDTYYVNFGDTISDVDGNGKIVIANEANQQSTLLEGNASPYLDSLGNILPNKWSLNGFDLTKINNNLIITKAGQDPNNSNVGKITVTDFVFSKPKAFLRNIFLSLFSVVFLFSSQSFAAETKPKTAQTKQENKQQEITDPDLKLSIDELKKKYPISLLDEKKKNYKPGQKINIDDYSIAEIKAAFLNADRNFISRIPESKIPMVSAGKVDVKILNNDVKVHSQLELDIIDESCNEFTWVTGSSPKKYQIMKSFLFSWEREIPLFIYRFVPIKTQSCFDTDTGWSGEQSDPFERN